MTDSDTIEQRLPRSKVRARLTGYQPAKLDIKWEDSQALPHLPCRVTSRSIIEWRQLQPWLAGGDPPEPRHPAGSPSCKAGESAFLLLFERLT